MVKDLGVELFRIIWVVVDMNKTSFAGDKTKNLEEQCITIAASIVKEYMDIGRQVGVIIEGNRFALFPPGLGKKKFWDVMKSLALIKADGQVPIRNLIEREKKRFGHNSLIILITASTGNGLTACLRYLSSQGISACAVTPSAFKFSSNITNINYDQDQIRIPVAT
jgi:uncharacterized protein (DUF58 family)